MAEKCYKHRITGNVICVNSEISAKDWLFIDSVENSPPDIVSTTQKSRADKKPKTIRKGKAGK